MLALALVFTGCALWLVSGRYTLVLSLVARLCAVFTVVPLIEALYRGEVSVDADLYRERVSMVGAGLAESSWEFGSGTDILVSLNAAMQGSLGLSSSGLTVALTVAILLATDMLIRQVECVYPDGKRMSGYSLFLLFSPSVVFWTSAYGKDAWCWLALLIALAGALALRNGSASPAIWWLAVFASVFGLAALRPYLAIVAIVTVGAFVGIPLNGSSRRWLRAGGIVVGAGLVILVLIRLQVGLMLGGSEGGLFEKLDAVSSATQEGGSAVELESATGVGSLVTRVPATVVALTLRPFPWEWSSPLALVAGLELYGLWLLYIWRVVHRDLRVTRIRATVPRLGFWLAVGSFVIIMASVFGNLGTLVRGRVFLFPILLLAPYLYGRNSALEFGPRVDDLKDSDYVKGES